jgi:hypothetical protein
MRNFNVLPRDGKVLFRFLKSCLLIPFFCTRVQCRGYIVWSALYVCVLSR